MSDLLKRAEKLATEAEALSLNLNNFQGIKKIYVAGPITGIPNGNSAAFHLADVKLSNKGFSVLNPALLPAGLEEHEYMDICMAMVRSCDAVYMLEGWEDSLGAQAEYHLAKKLEKVILRKTDMVNL